MTPGELIDERTAGGVSEGTGVGNGVGQYAKSVRRVCRSALFVPGGK